MTERFTKSGESSSRPDGEDFWGVISADHGAHHNLFLHHCRSRPLGVRQMLMGALGAIWPGA
jgi:hypothetical protein